MPSANAGPCCSKQLVLQEAKTIGDEFLALEKYVNLNYMVSEVPLKS
jgi:hypothetical protein